MAFLNCKCKVCDTEYHWCSTCDHSDLRDYPLWVGYCCWECLKKDKGEDFNPEDIYNYTEEDY